MIFAVHAIDRADAGNLRQEVRPDHLEYLTGFAPLHAGPLLDEAGSMCGSLILVDLPDLAAAEAFATGDPYARAGLFEHVVVRAHRPVFGPLAEG